MEDSLENKLFNKKNCGWNSISQEEQQNIFSFCDNYMAFLKGKWYSKKIKDWTMRS